jgi:hypothetical protein
LVLYFVSVLPAYLIHFTHKFRKTWAPNDALVNVARLVPVYVGFLAGAVTIMITVGAREGRSRVREQRLVALCLSIEVLTVAGGLAAFMFFLAQGPGE